ncbi:MAG TPA: hypothetical protein VN778_03180 [Verrucomicrobiae bacterium]|nr:hypothetical protein [Verrucomicrobiae bacterium]
MAFEQTTPPGIQPDGLTPSKAPVSDGGFSVEPKKLKPEGLTFPIDPETGLPHLVRVFYGTGDEGLITDVEHNYDHSWFPKRAPQLTDLGGKAVQLSMGQILPVSIHNEKNRRFCRLSWLPKNDDEKFEAVVKGISSVVSRWAVDVRRPASNLLVRLDDAEFAFLTDPKRLHRDKALKDKAANDRRDDIASFLVQHAIERNLREVITDRVINRFLNSEDEKYRRELGNLILKEALTARVEPFISSYSELKKKGFVRPGALPPIIAVRKFITKSQLPEYYPLLTKKLLATA